MSRSAHLYKTQHQRRLRISVSSFHIVAALIGLRTFPTADSPAHSQQTVT